MTTIRESNARFGTPTLDGRRKAWHVIGVTLNGAALCADCADATGIDTDTDTEANPVFASDDTDGMTCDTCHNVII